MGEPITFFNRDTQSIETEAIYGEGFLRWAYEQPLGRAMTWLLVKRAMFSHWYGWRMNLAASRAKIAPFISQYGVSTEEMVDAPESFSSFNAFFCRKLKPAARSIVKDENVVTFPADGRHFVIPDLSVNDGIFIKGVRFDLAELLRNSALATRFTRGSMLISRLCPVDYHRFHFPCGGVPDEPLLINGPLYSVNPIALRERPAIFWENKRYLTRLKSPSFGEVLLLEVGATCVGRVVHTQPAGEVAKGAEKGFFLFGGSCFITIFEPERIRFADDLLEHSAQRREVYARMGDAAARKV